ncbi:MAG TPA: phenylalanine--tRNA ligase beta subunit-related protein [Patescibacteria group bacterium]|nr:phenylalanine--tRNA ligase beta subunit-related protein [Patescibacteria group bacterium]
MIAIHNNIQQMMPHCRLAYSLIKQIAIRGAQPALTQEFLKLQAEVAEAYNLDMLPQLPRVAGVRAMYKKLNYDPSRYRPASEALVRRVLQKKDFYYVNSAVDVNNYCSVKFLLPFGMYDQEKIAGDIVYQRSAEGIYINIAGKEVSTDGKPFLTDEMGVFGNPTSDSRRTAVTLTTKDVLTVIYADENVSDEELQSILDYSIQMITCYNGGVLKEKGIVSA